MKSYWSKMLDRRVGRRRALAATGSFTAAAAFLAACGGDDDDGGGAATGGGAPTGGGAATGGGATGGGATGGGATGGGATGGGATGLLTEIEDSSSQAVRGGTLVRGNVTADMSNFDDYNGGVTSAGIAPQVYGKLLIYAPGHLSPATDAISADHAEEWEWSPDGLQLTLRLREGLKFHNIDPVNGRDVDVEDVIYGWHRFRDIANGRATYWNEVNPAAPIRDLTATDDRTIVIDVVEPLSYVEAMFASNEAPKIYPKEAADDNVLSLRNTMIGSGPFFVERTEASVGYTLARFPEYYNQDMPFVDKVEYPIIPEYATGISQFRSGGIHDYPYILAEEVVGLKEELPELNLYDNGFVFNGARYIFGYRQTPDIRDERVRQAISMSIERDLWIQTEFATDRTEADGLPVETRWHSHLTSGDPHFGSGMWLDPQGEEFGENARYFQFDVAEAKKLLAAAGFPDGIEIQSSYPSGGHPFGPAFNQHTQIWEAMLAEAGIMTDYNDILFQPTHGDDYTDIRGDFFGTTHKRGPNANTSHPIDFLLDEYSTRSGGFGFQGFDAGGVGDGSGDPVIEDMITEGLVIRDFDELRPLVHDLQRYIAQKMYSVRWPGGATQYMVVWPAVRNFRAFPFPTGFQHPTAATTWWIDETQPPFT